MNRPKKPRAKYVRRTWTPEETAELRRLWDRRHLTLADIAAHLDRTIGSIWTHGNRRGFPRRQKPWSPACARMIEQEVDQMIMRYAQRFERGRGAIASKIMLAATGYAKRQKKREIPDLGGMHSKGNASL